jgi:hypothetical protein
LGRACGQRPNGSGGIHATLPATCSKVLHSVFDVPPGGANGDAPVTESDSEQAGPAWLACDGDAAVRGDSEQDGPTDAPIRRQGGARGWSGWNRGGCTQWASRHYYGGHFSGNFRALRRRIVREGRRQVRRCRVAGDYLQARTVTTAWGGCCPAGGVHRGSSSTNRPFSPNPAERTTGTIR